MFSSLAFWWVDSVSVPMKSVTGSVSSSWFTCCTGQGLDPPTGSDEDEEIVQKVQAPYS